MRTRGDPRLVKRHICPLSTLQCLTVSQSPSHSEGRRGGRLRLKGSVGVCYADPSKSVLSGKDDSSGAPFHFTLLHLYTWTRDHNLRWRRNRVKSRTTWEGRQVNSFIEEGFSPWSSPSFLTLRRTKSCRTSITGITPSPSFENKIRNFTHILLFSRKEILSVLIKNYKIPSMTSQSYSTSLQ